MTTPAKPEQDQGTPLDWRTCLLIAAIVGLIAVAATVGAKYYNPPAAGDRTGVLIHPWDDTLTPDERAKRWCKKQGAVPRFVKIEKSGGWVYRCVPIEVTTPLPLMILNFSAVGFASVVPIAAFLWWLRRRRV